MGIYSKIPANMQIAFGTKRRIIEFQLKNSENRRSKDHGLCNCHGALTPRLRRKRSHNTPGKKNSGNRRSKDHGLFTENEESPCQLKKIAKIVDSFAALKL
jgi:hypothetical protein